MSTATAPKSEFGKFRSFFWPIHNFELKKIVPMLLMFFCINFNYTVLRDMKDTLIVATASGNAGAEAIPFLKLWGVLPMAVIFMLVYSKLSNFLSKPRLFYTMISTFIVFFILFALVLYPYHDALHPDQAADKLQAMLPKGFSGLISIFRNWTFALFYIMSELWGSVATSLLFWGFANDITKVSESKRFYSLFGIGANIAMLFSGPTIIYLCGIKDRAAPGVDPWSLSLNYLLTIVIASAILVMFIYRWMDKNVLTDSRFFDPSEVKKTKKEKPSLSLKESFAYLAKSKYVLCIATLVLAYGIAINLVEVTWKGQIKLQYPDSSDYMKFMGYLSTFTGAVTIFMLLISGPVIRRFGWGTAASITPIVLLVTGIAFFAFVIFRDSLAGVISVLGTTPVMMAVVFGMVQNIMSKSAKYSLFDPTKEMAYIPLDQEAKVKGKAAIDVVGARLGKSGGAAINQGLIIVLGSLAAITPYVAGISIFIVLAWILAAKSLNKQFLALNAEKETLAAVAQKQAELSKEAEVTKEAVQERS